MMKIRAIITALLLTMPIFGQELSSSFYLRNFDNPADVDWAIIGAGPAGIVVVGLLLDLGIPAKKILWIDPEFNVGRLSNYPAVPANSTLQSFIDFLNSCKTFRAMHSPALDSLVHYNPAKEYPLGIITDSLRDITAGLCSQVVVVRSSLKALDFVDTVWKLNIEDKVFTSHRVVLATGSHPRSLNYACSSEIPLDVALDKTQLAGCVKNQDGVAVVGGAHSAVLIMKFLSELGVARIVNFYNRPIQYAIDTGNGVLHAQYGLRGMAAEWARNVLEKNPPVNLVRFLNTEAARAAWLPVCNKIIYALGFERNELPPINGMHQAVSYDASTGVIAPHLFGIGIAFPEAYSTPEGTQEYRVGLNSFMAYAQRIMPEWMNKDLQTRFALFDSLFHISLL
jgi:hypothetical protein